MRKELMMPLKMQMWWNGTFNKDRANIKGGRRMTNKEASEELKEEFELFKTYIRKADWENPNEELKKIIEANTMAIEVLGQQPCEDCISREAVLDTEYQIKEINGIEYVMLSEVQMKIRKMPSVTPKYTDEEIDKAQAVEQAYVDKMVELAVEELKTPKAEWTPVSERLPEEAGVYLVSMFRLGYPQREVDGFVCGRWERFGNDVIAWCEIPEPYKAESEVQE